MKIQTEQLQALQQQAEARAKPRAEGVFDAILSEQIGAAHKAGKAAVGQPASPAAVFGLEAVAGVNQSPEAAAFAMVADSIDAMLGNLDEYTDTLSSPQGADLRKAYGILQGMDQNLAALREAAPDLARQHAGMASLVDEIAVITRTETVKLNRGDYL